MSKPVPLWRQIQKANFTRWLALADYLELNEVQRRHIIVDKKFPLNLPYRLASKIAKGTLEDPILRQFLPVMEENLPTDGFVVDPLQEADFRQETKLLHKYQHRALLVTTQACAMHCRYCFRRHFEYQQEDRTYAGELEYLQQDESIQEVLLSGGDPLSLDQHQIEYLLCSIDKIPHIKRIRLHSRFPIGIPERIDSEFISTLSKLRCQVWFVTHCNHVNELDTDVLAAFKKIQVLGIPVLNQAVLLKGVNDNPAELVSLCETLINHGILPYYLHQLDRVSGAAHFETTIDQGKELIRTITALLPGYGIPKYVQEIAGQSSKTPL